jgi:glycolate oxidase
VKISADPEQSARIWAGRKAAFGAIGRVADYLCMDGTIPLGQLPHCLTRISQICAEYGLKVANIFHAGDGNLHPLILYDANDPAQADNAELAGEAILKLCVELGGCLTGEHGVGIEKRELMATQFSQTDLMVQMRVKTVFDPTWRLNQAKVFPLAYTDVMRAGNAASTPEAA